MEGLLAFRMRVPVPLQQAVAGFGQGHRVVAVAGLAGGLDQPLLAEVTEVARTEVRPAAVMVAKVAAGNDAEGV